MHRLILAVIMFGAFCTPVHAQQDSLRQGDRIRVGAPQAFRDPVVGTLVGRPPGMLSIARASGRRDTVDIPVSLITTVEVSRGQLEPSQGLRRGVTRGLAAGVVVGAVLGGILALGQEARSEDTSVDELTATLGGAAVLGAAGAVVGGVVGTRKRERWERVPRPAVTFRGGSPAVTVSLTF